MTAVLDKIFAIATGNVEDDDVVFDCVRRTGGDGKVSLRSQIPR